jgi:pantothenate kinase-related protein Tda10
MSTIQIKAATPEEQIKQLQETLNNITLNLNKKKSDSTKPYLIGISGGSASGKTTVAQVIFKELSSTGIRDCVLISMDSYYKPLS